MAAHTHTGYCTAPELSQVASGCMVGIRPEQAFRGEPGPSADTSGAGVSANRRLGRCCAWSSSPRPSSQLHWMPRSPPILCSCPKPALPLLWLKPRAGPEERLLLTRGPGSPCATTSPSCWGKSCFFLFERLDLPGDQWGHMCGNEGAQG